MSERLVCGVIGAILGALIGVACWWLYGLAHSLNYDGPQMDPLLRHWLIYATTSFALFGLLFRDSVADLFGDALDAIFHFETNQTSTESRSGWFAAVYLAIIVAAIWFTVPGH